MNIDIRIQFDIFSSHTWDSKYGDKWKIWLRKIKQLNTKTTYYIESTRFDITTSRIHTAYPDKKEVLYTNKKTIHTKIIKTLYI